MEIVDCFLLCSVNLDRGRFRSAGLHPRRAQDTGLPENWNVPKIPSGLTIEVNRNLKVIQTWRHPSGRSSPGLYHAADELRNA